MILHGLSLGITYLVILNIFYKQSIKITKENLMLFISFVVVLTLGVLFSDLPSFILLLIEPTACVLLILVIKKKSLYDAILGYFAVYATIFVLDFTTGIIAYGLGVIDYLMQFGYHMGTILYPLGMLLAYVCTKPYQKAYIKLSTRSVHKKRKHISVIFLIHLTLIVTLFNFSNQTIINGAYNATYTNIYYVILVLYIPLIYYIISVFLKQNSISRAENLNLQKNLFTDDIIKKTYALTHDMKNVLQSINSDDNTHSLIDRMLDSKIDKAASNGIQLELSTGEKLPTLDEVDLSIILGILLDNAIEHLNMFKELSKTIQVTLDHSGIVVRNPLHAEIRTSLNQFKDFGYSSKQTPKSGYGLHNAENIAKKYNYHLNISQKASYIECRVQKNNPL